MLLTCNRDDFLSWLEIGVRMALGAERGRVLRMILLEALSLLAARLVLGAIVLTVAIRFVEGTLYGVSAFEPIRLAAITGSFRQSCVPSDAPRVAARNRRSADDRKETLLSFVAQEALENTVKMELGKRGN